MKNFFLFALLFVGLTLSSCAVLDVITEPGTETTPPPSKTPTTPKTTKKTNKVEMKPTAKKPSTQPRETKVIKKPVSKKPTSGSGSNKSGKVIKKPTIKNNSSSVSQKPKSNSTASRTKATPAKVIKATPAAKRVVKSSPAKQKEVPSTKKVLKPAKTVKPKVAQISFDQSRYNFGTIKEGTIIKRDFKFTNTGKDDLLIEIATGSCGCTVPEWPAKPIKPGQSEVIQVTFDSTDKEYDTRVEVNIVANTEPIVTEIIMTGKVIPKRDLKKKKG